MIHIIGELAPLTISTFDSPTSGGRLLTCCNWFSTSTIPLAQPAAIHEFQGHAAAAGAGGAADFPHAQHFLHPFFNRAGHQIFDIHRTGAGIASGDGDFRAVAAGLQFQRQAAQGDPAEDRQQAEQDEGAMPPADGGHDPAHGAFPTIFTIMPSRRPSPPRTTMFWPGRKASL